MFAFEYKSGIPILLVEGDVDVLNVDDFEAAVQELEGLNDRAVVISLERSPFVCVHAFGILLARGSRAAKRGQRFIVISPEHSFHRKILRLLHFPYEIAKSVEQALALIRRPGGTVAQI
jgi:anti-anti-sigma regulatory factor